MKIGIVTMVHNEEHIIEEWIAHHLAIGVTHIHLMDHQSTDATRIMIERIADNVSGVTVESWEHTADAHRAAYDRGLLKMTEEEVEWCAFLDADEFIVNGIWTSSELLPEFLSRHSSHCAIGLNWAMFGSSGHLTRPHGLIQERFLNRANDSFGPSRFIKSIVRPKYTMGAHHSHGFSLDYPYFSASGMPLKWTPSMPFKHISMPPELTGWRLNHYFSQWRGRWDAKVERSKRRGQYGTVRTEEHWKHHDRNEVFDPSALRWTPRDRTKMIEVIGMNKRCGPT